MTKNVNVQTNNATHTTVTTKTTKYTAAPCYMPIDKQDIGAEAFYKKNGIPVKIVNLFGSKRVCAIVPHPEYDESASEEEKAAVKEKAKVFSKNINDYRRYRLYHEGEYVTHEGISLTRMMEIGYDPSESNLDIAIKISTKMTVKDEINKELDIDESKQKKGKKAGSYSRYISDRDENGNSHCKTVCIGGYDSSSDLNNPEYICAKKTLYSKLHALVNELNGEELAIVQMIMDGDSEHEYIKEHGISHSYFHSHKNKLLTRLREALKDDYED